MNDFSQGQGTAGGTDVSTKLQGIIQQIGALIQSIENQPTLGTFTMAAGATLAVAEPDVVSGSNIQLQPLNASAATLMGSSKSLYISAKTAGSGFTVATADGTNAAGTEQFSYIVNSP